MWLNALIYKKIHLNKHSRQNVAETTGEVETD